MCLCLQSSCWDELNAFNPQRFQLFPIIMLGCTGRWKASLDGNTAMCLRSQSSYWDVFNVFHVFNSQCSQMFSVIVLGCTGRWKASLDGDTAMCLRSQSSYWGVFNVFHVFNPQCFQMFSVIVLGCTGRWKAKVDGDIAVFIVGAYINRQGPFMLRSLAPARYGLQPDVTDTRAQGHMLYDLSLGWLLCCWKHLVAGPACKHYETA
jgi:hypothetical protein